MNLVASKGYVGDYTPRDLGWAGGICGYLCKRADHGGKA